MAKSMTGFGRFRDILHGRELVVEIKSVNSRYLEYNAQLPRGFGFMAEPLKKAVSAIAARGKVDVYLGVQTLESAALNIAANKAAVRGYYGAMADIAKELGIPCEVSVRDFLRLPDVFCLARAEADEDEVCGDVLAVADMALQGYDAMRAAEGEKLVCDILERLSRIQELCAGIEAGGAERVGRYTARLYEKLRETLAGTAIDESRMLTEAAIFADKTAVDEETVRLRSHIAQYREILAQSAGVGRRLDFLTQEMNREANTVGSKCQDLAVSRLVVEMKAEIEKIREQIQNLE